MNPSIVDYLKSVGQPTDYASRATLAASKGITGYSGSAQQNTQLLNILRGGGGTSAPATTPATTAQPGQTQTPAQQTPAQTGVPPVDMSFYPGWNDQVSIQQDWANNWQKKTGERSTSISGASSGTTGFLNTPTINLPEIYQSLYDQSGVSGLEKQLSDQTKSFTDAQSKINDNPFLSEATRVGRIAKLNTDFNANSQGTRNDIATKKADIETKLNIQTKQFDINSQQATQALAQFQTLLSSGALSNASGEDIANITRATGMSSTMINAAIKAMKDKNIQTSTIQFDDGTNQGFAIINSNTGEIIQKQVIAASKPVKATGTSTSTTKDTATNKASVMNDARQGALLQDLIRTYGVSGSGLSVEDIYKLYNSNSIYGKAVETLDQVLKGQYSTMAGQ